MNQRGISQGTLLLMLMVGSGAYWAFFYGPHYAVKYQMDRIAIRTLEVWKETGFEEKAERHLRQEMADQELPDYIGRRSCRLRTQGLQRHVECRWHVEIDDPIFADSSLQFDLHKYLDPNNFLEDVM